MQKPKNILLAVNLIWSALAVGIVKSFIDLAGTMQHNPVKSFIDLAGTMQHNPALAIVISVIGVIGVIILGLMALLNSKISSGRNWARITFLVLYLLGMVPSFFIFLAIFKESVFAGVVFIFQAVVQAAALFLMFTKPGSEWFNKGAHTEALKQ